MSKKNIITLGIFICCIVCGALLFAGQSGLMGRVVKGAGSKKITIVATLFPQYDFARQIAGDKAEVTLLLPPGVESHTFEPSPSDIVKINKADMFIYTGKYMEIWADKVISGITNPKLKVIDASKGITLSKPEHDEHEHDHAKGHDHDDDKHDCKDDDDEDEHDGHHHEYDPHIWTDPLNAKIMVDNILAGLCEIDAPNTAYYRGNAEALKEKLTKLDGDFRKAVNEGKRHEIVFGGRNAFHYFLKRYGLDCMAAHDSCSTEAEASVKRVAELTDEIKEDRIPVIYYEEMTAPKVAKSISAETGAIMLPLYSCHNVSKGALEKGATYLSLMEQNLINLKEGLK